MPLETSDTYFLLYKIVGFPYRPDTLNKSVPVHTENEFLAIYRNKQSNFSLAESFVTKRRDHVCCGWSGILSHTIATCESALLYGQAEQATKLRKSILRRDGFVRFWDQAKCRPTKVYLTFSTWLVVIKFQFQFSIYFAFIWSIGVMTRRMWNLSIQKYGYKYHTWCKYNTLNFRIHLNRRHSDYNVSTKGLY